MGQLWPTVIRRSALQTPAPPARYVSAPTVHTAMTKIMCGSLHNVLEWIKNRE